MSAAATQAPRAPDLRAPGRHVRARRGRLARRRRRPPLPRPRSPASPSSGSATCHPAPLAAAHAQLDALWHVSNLYWTEPMAELAERLSDRFGGAQAFFCNSGAEAIEAALKYARKATGQARHRRARELVPRPHARRARRHGPAGEARRLRAARPGRRASPRRTTSTSLAAAADETTGCILLEPVQGEGGIHPARRRTSLAAARDARRRARRAARLRRGADRRRPHGHLLRVRAARRPSRTPSRSRRASRTACRSAPARRGRARRRVRAGRPRLHVRRQPRRLRRRVSPSATRSTSELLAAVRAKGALLARRLEQLPGVVEVRGRGLLLGAELDRPAARRRRTPASSAASSSAPRASASLRLTPPLTIAADELDHGARRSSRRCSR